MAVDMLAFGADPEIEEDCYRAARAAHWLPETIEVLMPEAREAMRLIELSESRKDAA